MINKISKPLNPLIYAVARDCAAEWFEIALSSGLKDTKYNKNPRKFAVQNLEKFIPIAVKTLLEMLKPTSNCTKEMREEIHIALTDPINDPDLMEGKKNGLPDMNLEKIIKHYDKNKIATHIQSPTVLHNPPVAKPKDLKASTSLN